MQQTHLIEQVTNNITLVSHNVEETQQQINVALQGFGEVSSSAEALDEKAHQFKQII